jgi:hypothetical protein
MPFKKGVSGNPKGKKKGTVNKKTAEARELFIQTLEGQVPNIQEAFEKVLEKSPEKYLDLFARYAQFFTPKKSEQDIKHEGVVPFDFNEFIRKAREDK